MKKISISIPCYNEEDNVEKIGKEIVDIFEEKLKNYDYEIQYIDNDSNDKTRNILRKMCIENSHFKAIFNAKNFKGRSGIYGAMQTSGDCTICMASDFQDPPELIIEFVRKWEEGALIVAAQKLESEEKKGMFYIRSIFYKLYKKFSNGNVLEHFTGFGLYDKKFLDIIRSLNDPIPTMRGMVADFGYDIVTIEFKQPIRKRGKSKQKFSNLFDLAIELLTVNTKVGIRFFLYFGLFSTIFSILITLTLVFSQRIMNVDNSFDFFIPLICISSCFQIFILGLLGEHISNINKRLLNRPLVIEKERINFQKEKKENG